MTNNWRCPAIDRGVTIYDDGVIRPCCAIDWSYSKPIAEIRNPDRFKDLYADGIPAVCKKCTRQENNNLPSRRQYQLALEKQKPNNKTTIQYIDLRNTNLCNARCEFCGPHHTNQWPGAVLRYQDIAEYTKDLFSDDLIEIYFAGGEPLISRDHFMTLDHLINNCDTTSINLRYSSNLSTLKYKDADFVQMWKKFKSVLIMPSADATGLAYENIRVGLNWETFETNLKTLIANKIKTQILFVLCTLNIWTIKETLDYFRSQGYAFSIEILNGPDELRLRHVADKDRAVQQIQACGLPNALTDYIIKEIHEQE
jgi:sulfatase maturation enzyme AslB (radical SAM superfamily)